MDEQDIKTLAFLRRLSGISHPSCVREYEVARKGRNGDYMAVLRIFDEGSDGDKARFTATAFNKETNKGTSSNAFPELETALATLDWSALD
jgi:hypothetical protein